MDHDFSKEPWDEPPHHETAIATDTETSGFKPGVHGIVALGAVGHDYTGKELGRFGTLVNPGDDTVFDPKAMAVNGISMEDVANAPHIRDVLPAYIDKLKEWHRSKTYENPDRPGSIGTVPATHLVGHNLGFDLDHIRAAIEKHTPKLAGAFGQISRNQYDTQQHSPVAGKQRTLAGLGKVVGVDNAAPHTVMGDVDQTMGIYHQLRGRERMGEKAVQQFMANNLAQQAQQPKISRLLPWITNRMLIR